MGDSVTDRALAVLGAFDAEHPRLGLTQLARRAGLPMSTCHRLVTTLVAWGALERSGNTYRIGRRIWELGLLAPTQQSAIELATPFMQDVLFVTRNVVNLSVLDGDRALLIERIAGTAVGVPFRKVGDRMDLHGSASGKVLLAHAADALVDQCCRNLTALTPKTITDPQVLRAQLAQVRRQGYAVPKESRPSTTMRSPCRCSGPTGRCSLRWGSSRSAASPAPAGWCPCSSSPRVALPVSGGVLTLWRLTCPEVSGAPRE